MADLTSASTSYPLVGIVSGMSDIKSVGILGSGIMGSGLAEVAAKAGYTVIVRSRTQATADAMVASLGKSLAKQVERGKLADEERTAILGRVSATDSLGACASPQCGRS